MSTIAPPRPPPQEDLEALIKEARRRARRRRLIYAAVAALLLATGGGVYAIVALMGGGGSPASVPEGFHLVKAKGPVAHARIEQYTRYRPTVIDLASGTERRVSFVLEEWWDERTGLDRVVLRNEGRVQADVVGQSCQPKPRFCFPLPPPFDLGRYGLRWPLDEKRFRVLGRGRFRGHDVIWVKSLVSNVGVQKGDRLAYGAVTHELVAKRSALGPTEEVYTLLPDLPAAGVSFVVPEGGGALHSFPPSPQADTESSSSSLRAARDAIGAVPLWLGPRFQGAKLESVEVGTEGMKARTGATLLPARFVTFDYGTVKLQEFGSDHPFWYEQGPRPGRVVIDSGTRAALTRGGVLVVAESEGQFFDAGSALAIVKALRPVG